MKKEKFNKFINYIAKRANQYIEDIDIYDTSSKFHLIVLNFTFVCLYAAIISNGIHAASPFGIRAAAMIILLLAVGCVHVIMHRCSKRKARSAKR